MTRDYLPGIMRVFSNITPVVIFFIFAQIVNVSELGLINYFISLITILGIFTDFGLPEAIQRFLPQVKDKAKLITYTIKLEILIVLIGAFLFLMLDLLTKGDFSKGYLFILILTFIFSASNTIILIFNGLEEKKKLTEYFAYSSLLFLTITFNLYFIFDFDPVTSFIYGRLISWAIYTIIPLYHLYKQKLLLQQEFNIKQHTKFNKFAKNTFIYMASLTLLTQWDSILITNIDGTYTNGLYKSVAFIATIPIVLITILHTKLLPLFSKLNAKKRFQEIQMLLQKYIKYLLIILGISFLIQLFIYKYILNIFLTEEVVKNAGHLFPIIFLAVCLQILISPYISALQAIGQARILRNLTIIQVFTFILFSIILYPSYSYNILPTLLVIINTVMFFLITLITYNKIHYRNNVS